MSQNSKSTIQEKTGPTLRSSTHKEELNEVRKQGESTKTKDKEQICADFFSVVGTVLAAGVSTVVVQFINTHLSNYRHSICPSHRSSLQQHHKI